MQGDFSFIIVLGLIAVFLLLRLRSTMGQRNDEDGPMDGPRGDNYLSGRFQRHDGAGSGPDTVNGDNGNGDSANRDNVIELPGNRGPVTPPPAMEQDFRTGNNAIDDALDQMARMDRNFSAGDFMNGARAAYEMIIDAYATGDVRLLRGMLNKDVFESFNGAIEARSDAGHVLDHTLISLDDVVMEEAQLDNSFAAITVRFTSQQIDALRDSEGEVIEGDDVPAEVIDIWTFARDLSSSDPNWTLIATSSPEA